MLIVGSLLSFCFVFWLSFYVLFKDCTISVFRFRIWYACMKFRYFSCYIHFIFLRLMSLGNLQSFDHGYYLLVKSIQELRSKKDGLVTIGIGGPIGSGKSRSVSHLHTSRFSNVYSLLLACYFS